MTLVISNAFECTKAYENKNTKEKRKTKQKTKTKIIQNKKVRGLYNEK